MAVGGIVSPVPRPSKSVLGIDTCGAGIVTHVSWPKTSVLFYIF